MSCGPADLDTVLRHEERAEDLLDDHAYEEALAEADKALALQPHALGALVVQAEASKALGRFSDAVAAMEVIAKITNLASMRVNLANMYAALERHSKAEEHLCLAIQTDPTLAEAHASLGSVYMRMMRYDLAERPTRQALSLDPFNIVANQNLAAIVANSGASGAQAHRDESHLREQVFLEPSLRVDAPVALILSSAGPGNVPHQHLMTRAAYGRILWFIQYAPPGQVHNLPAHDFVFNAVGDPDAAPEAQRAAEAFAGTCNVPVINYPDKVARTLRSEIKTVLSPISDLLVPNVERFTRGDGALADQITASGLRFPLIVRPAGLHGGVGTMKVDDIAELAQFRPGLSDAIYATEYRDYRSPDGLYRKYRVVFVDRRPYPYHLAIGDHWLLHYWTAGMEKDAKRRGEEARFLEDPQSVLGSCAWKVLESIAQAIDLDYAGIDFSVLPDGRILFFEANATMLVHPEDEEIFSYKNRAFEAIVEAVSQMIIRKCGTRAEKRIAE